MPVTMLTFPVAAPAAAPTIAGLLDGFLDYAAHSRGRSANTIRSYRSDLAILARELPQTLDTITRRDLERVTMTRDERPATTNRRIASFKQFFRWARREGSIAIDPAEDLEPKVQTVGLPRPIPADDLRVLDRDAVERLIFTILRETGMRADEVLSLNICDVTRWHH